MLWVPKRMASIGHFEYPEHILTLIITNVYMHGAQRIVLVINCSHTHVCLNVTNNLMYAVETAFDLK